jgi:nicotinate dehydrogenase subunit A
MLMMAVALLEDTPRPTEGQVRQALSGNLCRCGTHIEIVQAVLRAAELLAADRPAPGVPADAAHPAR